MRRRPLEYCATEVRKFDPDRFLTVLFAPAHARDALFTLYAFNLEIAKIHESVSEPILAQMRFQWWRDTLDGIFNAEPPSHPIAKPLQRVVHDHNLRREYFDALIEARAVDITKSPPEFLDDFIRYGAGTTVPLVLLALDILGPADERVLSVARDAATAWAMTGLMRALPFNLRKRRNYLPTKMMAEYGVDTQSVGELRPTQELAGLIQSISKVADSKLVAVRKERGVIGPEFLSPLLIAPLARQYNRRFARVAYNIFDPAFAESPPLRAWRLVACAFMRRI
jgi:NADH dehydrogenase [ubiquinone] 1 alpha subcomplex assembly factor 6